MYGNAILWHAMHLHNLPHRNQMNTSRPSMQPISKTTLSPVFNCFFSAFHSSETLNSVIPSVIMQQLFFPGHSYTAIPIRMENNCVFRGHSIFPIYVSNERVSIPVYTDSMQADHISCHSIINRHLCGVVWLTQQNS